MSPITEILQFTDDYAWLSNFYPSPVIPHDQVRYPTVEHAFQAMKTHDINERLRIADLATPRLAKREGRRLSLRPDWNAKRIPAMRYLLTLKFFPGSNLEYCLFHTGDAHLEEGNTWSDRFWGVDLHTREGENHLGQLLMELRSSIH